MPASAAPKSIYHFPNYIMAPRAKRTYLDEGGPTDPSAPIDPTMMAVDPSTLGAPTSITVNDTAPSAPDPTMAPSGGDLDWRSMALGLTPQGQAATPDVGSLSDSPLPSPLTSAFDKEKGLYAGYPIQSQPKWWQRAAGAGVGFLEGMANAGHIRTPINIAQSEQNILYPGYDAKVAEWRSKFIPAAGDFSIEQQRQAAAQKQEQINAQAEQRIASADYRRREADPHYQMQQISPEMGQAHGIMPDKDGTYWALKNAVPNLMKADRSLVKQWSPQEAAAAASLGLDPHNIESWPTGQAKQFFDMTQKQTGISNSTELEMAAAKGDPVAQRALDDENRRHVSVAQASRQPVDPTIAMMREDKMNEQKQGALDRVGEQKINNQKAVLEQRRSEVAKILPQGMAEADVYAMQPTTPQEAKTKADFTRQIAGINQRFAPQLQAIEDQFASAGSARGVQTTPMQVNPQTLEYAPRGAGAPAGQQPPPKPVLVDPLTVKLPTGGLKKFPNAQAASAYLAAITR